LNSIIGFVLIFGILLYMLWQNQPTPEEIEAQKAKQEQLAKEKNKEESQEQSSYQISPDDLSNMSGSDSTKLAVLKNKFGAFAYGAGLETGQDAITEVKTDLLTLKFNSKGGFLSEVKLNKFVNYDSVPIYLINDNNSVFNITFGTSDNRTLNTKDLYFQPQVTNNGDKTIVSMKLKVSENEFLEHRYEIANDDYMIGLTLRSQGLSSVINSSQNMVLDWRMKTFRHDQSIVYENRYTRLTYQHDGGNKIDKLAQGGDDEEEEKDVSWISYRQHFFSTILVPDTPFKSVKLASRTLVKNEDIDTVYTKEYASKLALNISGGELSQPMKLYFGPTDSKILKKYENNLEESIPFGWGIFGWINKALFI
ncbi:MAG TPA: membrane protein insertase YidC, partial [Aquaticitalea sp.]|nr:membrane protein insertase YidC [Aquaticitalea sp.]